VKTETVLIHGMIRHVEIRFDISNPLTSAKNILPHVLHTYLPVSPGNTISPYTPHASHFSVLF